MSIETDPRIAFFDRHAPLWDGFGPPLEQTLARLESLKDRMGLKAGQDLLEVGCGTGQVTAWLENVVRPGRVTAIDFSPGMLALAQARGTDAAFHQRDACSDELGDARFDCIFCMHVLPHFRDLPAALARLTRALRPGGRLIILHLMGRDRLKEVHGSAHPAVREDHLPDAATLTARLAAVGLTTLHAADRDDLYLVVATLDRVG